jgi:hypothetical protein
MRFELDRRNWIAVLVRAAVDAGIPPSDAEAEPGLGICDRPPPVRSSCLSEPETNSFNVI